MPVYEYACPVCGVHREELQGAYEQRVLRCDNCNLDMDKVWFAPQIISDCAYAHVREDWGVEVRGRSHWREEMAKRGEVPFEAAGTDESKAALREAKYIAKNSRKGDKEARACAKSVMDEASRKGRRKRIQKRLMGE